MKPTMHMLASLVVAFCCALQLAAQSAVARDEVVCQSSSQCNASGSSALAKGRVDDAIHLFKKEIILSEKAHNTKDALLGYNNMAIAYYKSRNNAKAKAWVDVARRLDPRDKKTIYNLALIKEHLAQPAPNKICGLYVQYAGMGLWSHILVFKEHGEMRFALTAYRVDTASDEFGPASYGDLDGSITRIDAHTAFFSDPDYPACKVRFSSDGNAANVMQSGDCGFGYGVDASGRYERIREQASSRETASEADLP